MHEALPLLSNAGGRSAFANVGAWGDCAQFSGVKIFVKVACMHFAKREAEPRMDSIVLR